PLEEQGDDSPGADSPLVTARQAHHRHRHGGFRRDYRLAWRVCRYARDRDRQGIRLLPDDRADLWPRAPARWPGAPPATTVNLLQRRRIRAGALALHSRNHGRNRPTPFLSRRSIII